MPALVSAKNYQHSFSSPISKYKELLFHSDMGMSEGLGINWRHTLKLYIFYVMGKALWGELSCKGTGLILFFFVCTLKCLSIGTPKTINLPFVPNGKLTVFKCPKI